MKHLAFKRILCIVLAFSMLLSLTSCLSSGNGENTEKNSTDDAIVVDNVVISDSFVPLKINEIEIRGIETVEVDVKELNLHTIDDIEIKTVEVATVTLSDEFVYLAYQNFVSCYEDNINIKKLLIDAAIGATCVIVIVGLSYCGGPVGTYFGAIITSELSKAAVVIGAAIDAAVSGYQAYAEGGDFQYICGHILNGVVEGFAWSALLAPATGAVSGVKAVKAVKAVQKIPGMEKLTHDAARAVLNDLEKIIKETGKIAVDSTDATVKKLYKSIASDLSQEITEDVFLSVVKNQSSLVSIVKKLDPFGISKNVGKALKEQFCQRAGLTDDAAKEFIKQVQNNSIKSINSIQDINVKEYVESNLSSFVECFGSSLSKEFLDECIKESVSDKAFSIIKNSVATENLYVELIKELGKETTDEFLDNTNTLLLLQLRYGAYNLNRLLNVKNLYNQLLKGNKIDESSILKALNGILDGSIKSIDDMEKISTQIAKNIQSSREAVASLIKQLGREKKAATLLGDLASQELVRCSDNIIPHKAALDIVNNELGKSEIITKYGNDVYEALSKNASQSITAISMKSSVNKNLMSNILSDYLKNAGIQDDTIKMIVKGTNVELWNISDKQLQNVGQTILSYYKGTKSDAAHQFILDMAEKRGNYIAEFVSDFKNKGNTIRNGQYAGQLMAPAGENADLVKAKYGEIYMSQAGFPIFDEHAIAVVQLDSLTGLNSGADDIARANMKHHGTTITPPGYTWHHLEDGKTMILIPTELHEAYRHTGGADLLREGLKEAING